MLGNCSWIYMELMNYSILILNQCFILLGIDIAVQIFVVDNYYSALSWCEIYML